MSEEELKGEEDVAALFAAKKKKKKQPGAAASEAAPDAAAPEAAPLAIRSGGVGLGGEAVAAPAGSGGGAGGGASPETAFSPKFQFSEDGELEESYEDMLSRVFSLLNANNPELIGRCVKDSPCYAVCVAVCVCGCGATAHSAAEQL